MIDIQQLKSDLTFRLLKKLMDAEDDAILHGSGPYIEPTSYKYQIHGIGYNDHYCAVMSYFSSHELNVLRHNEVYVWQHKDVNRSKLFNLGVGIGSRLKKRLIYADQIGLIKLV